MENTIENKTKLFVQYWGQTIMMYENSDFVTTIHEHNLEEIPLSYLQLIPLSQITDEDAVECLRHFTRGSGNSTSDYEYCKSQNYNPSQMLSYFNKYKFWNYRPETIDYLRSKGYALPYNGLSVENQIQYGWIKLVE